MDYLKYVEAIKQKDEEAFEAIYYDTKYVVYSMITSIIKDRFLAEDIMQEVYMKMVEKINYYDPKYKFINWLLTLTKNLCLDHLKSKKEVLVESEALDSYQEIKEEKKTLDINKYLKVLNEEEKQIVLLKIVKDLKHKDIALVLNKPLGTVLWIYNKAIKKMKKEVKDEN
ncbi:MAG: sigma-70 family RNA polymerase sigma factor [Bacilli bacterium]|nr:sigma-70 family RNA polymerase sigma factor [Bacilli bacterium]